MGRFRRRPLLESLTRTGNYALRDHDHITFVGLHAGKQVSLDLQRNESPLLTRGFHWLQEFPFNR
jgi:hypothetical protein